MALEEWSGFGHNHMEFALLRCVLNKTQVTQVTGCGLLEKYCTVIKSCEHERDFGEIYLQERFNRARFANCQNNLVGVNVLQRLYRNVVTTNNIRKKNSIRLILNHKFCEIIFE